MGRRKVSTTIYITPEQAAQLKALSEKTKVPIAEYIRQGIDRILAEHPSASAHPFALTDEELDELEGSS